METAGDLRAFGWNAWANFSYGMHKPYGSEAHKSPLTDDRQPGFVVFADKNWQEGGTPGQVYFEKRSDYRRPGNHPRDGFNYLTHDGSEFTARYEHGVTGRYSAVGLAGDDIYVADDNGGTKVGTASAAADPTRTTDTFILPWEGKGDGLAL